MSSRSNGSDDDRVVRRRPARGCAESAVLDRAALHSIWNVALRRLRERQLSDPPFDGYLPRAHCREQYRRALVFDEITRRTSAVLAISASIGRCECRAESSSFRFRIRTRPTPQVAAVHQSPLESQIPSSYPSCLFPESTIGTNRATGRPPEWISISSPLATLRSSCDKCVFASCTPTAVMDPMAPSVVDLVKDLVHLPAPAELSRQPPARAQRRPAGTHRRARARPPRPTRGHRPSRPSCGSRHIRATAARPVAQPTHAQQRRSR